MRHRRELAARTQQKSASSMPDNTARSKVGKVGGAAMLLDSVSLPKVREQGVVAALSTCQT